MRRWTISLCILLMSSALVPAQDESAYRRLSSQVSPRGSFELETYQHSQVLRRLTEIRIEPLLPGMESQVLFRGAESTWALISPDETWIAINSAESERKGLLYLFKRERGGRFVEVETQVERQALAALMKVAGRTATPRFDAFFCYADFWSDTSGCFLGHIEARERGEKTNSRFYFVYDPAEQRVSLDLKIFNRGAFRDTPPP